MKRFFLPSLLVVASLFVGMGLLGQGRSVTADVVVDQYPTFSIDFTGPSSTIQPGGVFHPADILSNPGAPMVCIPCAGLGLGGTGGCAVFPSPSFDDLDALSYGADFLNIDPGYIGFSVAKNSAGQPGTAVNAEASCVPDEPEADEFYSSLDGNNTQVFDGDAIDCTTGLPVPGFGLWEVPQPPASDVLDALDNQDCWEIDPDMDGIPNRYVYFSLHSGAATLLANTWGGADILVTIGGLQPWIYAPAWMLGLQGPPPFGVPEDDVNGLCLADMGMDDYFDPANPDPALRDYLFYTVTPTSPSIPAGVPDAATIMYVVAPGVAIPVDLPAALGLLPSDDLDAIKCVKALVDISIEEFVVTLPDGTEVRPGDDVTMDMKVDEWATLTVEEQKHYIWAGEELSPPFVTSDVWWALTGVPLSQLNVRWVPQAGDICTLDGTDVPCSDPDINDLHWQIDLFQCDPVTVTREVEVHCKLPTEEPFTVTFTNIETPIVPEGANELTPFDNESYIDLNIVCEDAPENPSFTVGESIIPTPSGNNPGDILRLNGQKGAPPVVGIPCANLGLNPANCAAQLNDLNALSYGAEPPVPLEFTPDLKFSITEEVWPDGLPGTDVNKESTCAAAPGQAHGDEFDVNFPLPAPGVGGTNTLVLDENGIQDAAGCAAPPGYPVGTPLPGDDINGLVDQGPDYVDTDGDTIPENPVYFTLDAGSADLPLIVGAGPDDVLMTQNGLQPTIWAAGAADLGLVHSTSGPPDGDEIDALCIYEDGDGAYNPLTDIVWLSLAPGSPTLGALGATAADVLASRASTVSIEYQADQLGLEHPSIPGVNTDNLNAMKCWLGEPAMPTGDLRIEKYDQASVLVGGATFTINPDPADGLGAAITVTDGGAGDPDGMADGIIVLAAVPTTYTVTETVAPPGCTITGPPQVAVVTAGASTIVSFSDDCAVAEAHYGCFLAPGIPPLFPPVMLETQFGIEEGVEIGPGHYLCPPAIKTMPGHDPEGTLDAPHLRCFDIDGPPPGRFVNLETQFGIEENVEVGPARLLCAPTSKELIEPPGPSFPGAEEPHYKCYEITGDPIGVDVLVETQFGAAGTVVMDPRLLCLPAGKNGREIPVAPHLECYTADVPPDLPYLVGLETQFGTEMTEVGPGELLCVPAEKEVVIEDPTFSIARGGPSTPAPVDPADLVIRTLPGGVWPPTVAYPCPAFTLGFCGGPDDVNALSLGRDFTLAPPDPANPNASLFFSVDPASVGLAGSGVNNETLGCVPEPEADEFGTGGGATNYQYFDGDGIASCANPGAPSLGLVEPPPVGGPSDDLDALDPLNLSASGPPIFASLEQASPSLGFLPHLPTSAADIFVDFGMGIAGLYAPAGMLGLDMMGPNTDDVDALCIDDADGDAAYTPGDRVWFSLTRGSATLPLIGLAGATAADVLAPDPAGGPPVVVLPAMLLGLTANDELNALKCYQQSPCVFTPGDDDCDACWDVSEPGLAPPADPSDPWDWYDVPVPTLGSGGHISGDPSGLDNRDHAISIINDVLAVLEYAGTSLNGPPNSVPRDYDDDVNGDGVPDGVAYDRSVGALRTGVPDGAVTIIVDVLAVLAQSGQSC